MKKMKRILAGAGALLLLGMYLSTIILALIGSPNALRLLKASIACTVILPVLLYAFILVYRVAKGEDSDNHKK